MCPSEWGDRTSRERGRFGRFPLAHDQGKAQSQANASAYDRNPASQARATYNNAARKLNAARTNSKEVQQRLIQAARQLGKIAADELGITAAFDCFTRGDIGGCAETALNTVASLTGGLAGKIISKYAWRWKAGAKLAKAIWKLGSDIISGIKGYIAASSKLKEAERAVEVAATSCKFNSFSGRTPVVMANGARRPISKVKVGERVKAIDPATGKVVSAVVSRTYVNQDTAFTDLTFRSTGRGRHRTETLHTTSHHRIWNVTAGTWAYAVDFAVGDRARTDDGRTWTVRNTRSWSGSERMYDITVDGVHTFFAATGTLTLLVHNCGDVDGRAADALSQIKPGVTKASRACQKHMGRSNTTLIELGGRDARDVSQTLVEDVLTSPRTVTRSYVHTVHGPVDELRLPDIAVLYKANANQFISFFD